MAKFLTKLTVEGLTDTVWILVSPLKFQTDAGEIITVPVGFITDFASVPRLPLTFALFGDTAHEAAVIHDYLYTTKSYSRAAADAVFLSAMKAKGVASWRRFPMFLAVRAFGGLVRGGKYVS